MALFSRKKKPGADQRELLKRLDGRELQTVTRRDPETSAETVIGKAGRINTLHGQIVIVCDGREVFRCDAATARCGELMSLNGVVIRGREKNGQETTVVAYYLYYRKV